MSCLSLRPEQLTDSVRVHFKVNQTVIDSLLMDNDEAMRGFADRLQTLRDNDTVNVTVSSILITGAASPEGSIALNEHLSRERAAAITRWLQEYLVFPDTLPEFVFKGRDWQGLLARVAADPDVPYKNEVTALLQDIVKLPPPRHLQV